MRGGDIDHRKSHLTSCREPSLGGPSIKAPNLLKAVSPVKIEKHKCKKDLLELFTDLGKLEHVFQIRWDVASQQFSSAVPRGLPLPMKHKELRLEKEDIICSVKSPKDWCAPLVVVQKSNGKVRLCVDFTKSVQRENFFLLTTDHLQAELD